MIDPAHELKVRAEILQKRAAAGDEGARARLGALAAEPDKVQRKHCLAVVAREAGFASWEHALRVFRGDPAERDLGTLLEGRETRGTLNAWYADHAEARAHLAERRARGEEVFLLGYKRQFVVVELPYVAALGLDPADPDWRAIGFDWGRPRDAEARARLYGKRLAALREAP